MKKKTIYALFFLGITSLVAACKKSQINNSETDENFAEPKTMEEAKSSENLGEFETLNSAESLSNALFIPDRVGFEFDKSSLTESQIQILEAQLKFIKENEDKIKKIRISGYADQRGSIEYNHALGERRANTVKQFFIQKGIERVKIETISYGKQVILVEGNTEEAYKENRVARTSLCETESC